MGRTARVTELFPHGNLARLGAHTDVSFEDPWNLFLRQSFFFFHFTQSGSEYNRETYIYYEREDLAQR